MTPEFVFIFSMASGKESTAPIQIHGSKIPLPITDSSEIRALPLKTYFHNYLPKFAMPIVF